MYRQLILSSALMAVILFPFLFRAAEALDLNRDGRDELIIYNRSVGEVIAISSRGEFVSRLELGAARLRGRVYPVVIREELGIVTVEPDGLIRVYSQSGLEAELSIGDLLDITLFIEDIDKNGSFDLLMVQSSGRYQLISNPLSENPSIFRSQLAGVKNSVFSLTIQEGRSELRALSVRSRKRRTKLIKADIYSGDIQRAGARARIYRQVLPIGDSEELFYSLSSSAQGLQLLSIHSLNSRKPRRVQLGPETILATGSFSSTGKAELLMLDSDSLRTFDASSLELVSEFPFPNVLFPKNQIEISGPELFLLAKPVYFERVPQALGVGRNGCGETRPIADGAGGALAKNSDHDGNLVFLAPPGVYTNSCELIRRSGGLVERLNFTGYANGGRAHHRGRGQMQSYPKVTWIRCQIESFYSSSRVCFTTNNFRRSRID